MQVSWPLTLLAAYEGSQLILPAAATATATLVAIAISLLFPAQILWQNANELMSS